MKIAFHDNILSVRGTTVALFDYCYWTKQILGIDPIILYNKTYPQNEQEGIARCSEFPVFGYSSNNEIDDILKSECCEKFFAIKGGKYDGIVSNICENLILAVSGHITKNDFHGDKFAVCSQWLSNLTGFQCVPHIIYLPPVNSNLRKQLNIPNKDLVIGRNGGYDTFDLDFVKSAIKKILNIRNDIWFVFQNTEKFYDHDRIIYFDRNSDLIFKTKFINTCDAMIHARHTGESFGLSCGEFSIRNKPVITWSNSVERNHIETLKEKGIYYNTEQDIYNIFSSLNKKEINCKDWNCYEEFSPINVIKKFEEVYL